MLELTHDELLLIDGGTFIIGCLAGGAVGSLASPFVGTSLGATASAM